MPRTVEEFKAGQIYEVLKDWKDPVDPFFKSKNVRYELKKGEKLRFKNPNLGYAVFYDNAGKAVHLKPRTAFRIIGSGKLSI